MKNDELLFEVYFIQELTDKMPSIDRFKNIPGFKEVKNAYEDIKWNNDKIEMIRNRIAEVNKEIQSAITKGDHRTAKNLVRGRDKLLKVELGKRENEKKELLQKITGWLSDAKKKVTTVPKDSNVLANPGMYFSVAAASVVAAAMGVAAFKLYKNYFSKAAKSCKGTTGKYKEICMSKYKINSLEKAKNLLKGKLSTCSKAKDKEKCSSELKKQIERFDKKISKVKKKMSKLQESKMHITEEYLIYLQESEDGYLTEAPAAAAAAGGVAGALGAAGKLASSISPVSYAFYALPYAIKAANFAYKNIFNKAHKACKGIPKEDYTNCIRKYKIQAMEAQAQALAKELPKCKKAKKPEECQKKIQNKIKEVKFRVENMKKGLAFDRKAALAKAKAAGQAQAAKQQAQPQQGQQ